LLTYGNIETGPDSESTAYAAVGAAVHRRSELWGENGLPMPEVKTDHLTTQDMACIVATGYGRVVVPFAQGTLTEISCHARGPIGLCRASRPSWTWGGRTAKRSALMRAAR